MSCGDSTASSPNQLASPWIGPQLRHCARGPTTELGKVAPNASIADIYREPRDAFHLASRLRLWPTSPLRAGKTFFRKRCFIVPGSFQSFASKCKDHQAVSMPLDVIESCLRVGGENWEDDEIPGPTMRREEL